MKVTSQSYNHLSTYKKVSIVVNSTTDFEGTQSALAVIQGK